MKSAVVRQACRLSIFMRQIMCPGSSVSGRSCDVLYFDELKGMYLLVSEKLTAVATLRIQGWQLYISTALVVSTGPEKMVIVMKQADDVVAESLASTVPLKRWEDLGKYFQKKAETRNRWSSKIGNFNYKSIWNEFLCSRRRWHIRNCPYANVDGGAIAQLILARYLTRVILTL